MIAQWKIFLRMSLPVITDFNFLEPRIYLSENFLIFCVKSELERYSKDLTIKRIAIFMV